MAICMFIAKELTDVLNMRKINNLSRNTMNKTGCSLPMKVDTTCTLQYLVQRLVFLSLIRYAYCIKGNVCTEGYAIVSRRKGWEKQGWNKQEHGRDVVAHSSSFLLNRTNTYVARRKMPHARASARERNRSEAAHR